MKFSLNDLYTDSARYFRGRCLIFDPIPIYVTDH